jgi:RNA polymerase sigma-70 factor (ECF subfamily)
MVTTANRAINASGSEEGLVQCARQGSGTAFVALALPHGDAVYAMVRNMSSSLRDAEDAIQQTYVTAWHDFGRFPEGARFSTWLYGIAMATVLSRRKRGRRTPSFSFEALRPEFDADGRLVDSGGRRDDGLGRFNLTAVLREALENIDDRTRAAFVLRDLLELSAEEAAVILRTSPRDIRQKVHEARIVLRGLMDRF